MLPVHRRVCQGFARGAVRRLSPTSAEDHVVTPRGSKAVSLVTHDGRLKATECANEIVLRRKGVQEGVHAKAVQYRPNAPVHLQSLLFERRVAVKDRHHKVVERAVAQELFAHLDLAMFFVHGREQAPFCGRGIFVTHPSTCFRCTDTSTFGRPPLHRYVLQVELFLFGS